MHPLPREPKTTPARTSPARSKLNVQRQERQNPEASTLLQLQHTIGNAAVVQLTRAGAQRATGSGYVHQSSLLAAPPGMIMLGKAKAGKAVVGWIIKVGERKLIKTAAIYSEKEMGHLLAKGYNILVKRGSAQAKKIARRVWGDDFIHHTGHIIKKTGKKGLSHFQPRRHLIGKAGEKGWHIFYSVMPVIFFSEFGDAEAMEIYEDKYPGESIAHYLTVTKYAGEDSWLSYLDWINPLELLAIGGDIGRDWDRERTKELKALVFNRVAADGSVQTYELDPEGELVRVIVVRPDGQQKTLSADEYYTFLGRKSEEAIPNPPAQDGAKHPNYASTFDADYRIYNSRQHSTYDPKTLSLYLPEQDTKPLQRIGEFYVREDLPLKYVFAFVHPRYRALLKGPGFLVPGDMIGDYLTGPKDVYLREMLAANIKLRIAKDADLWQAK